MHSQDISPLDLLGPADPEMLRSLADDIDTEGTWVFGDLHAARLRALADRLDTMDANDALRAQADALAELWKERALIERAAHDHTAETLTRLIRDLAARVEAAEAAGRDPRVTFIFTSCEECGGVTTAATLDMELASELVLLIDAMQRDSGHAPLVIAYHEAARA